MIRGADTDCSLECQSSLKQFLLGKEAKNEKGGWGGRKATPSPLLLNTRH